MRGAGEDDKDYEAQMMGLIADSFQE